MEDEFANSIKLRITYNARRQDIETLLARIQARLLERELVEKDSVVVHFIHFGDVGLEILVRCYVLLKDWEEFTAEKERIYLELMSIVEELGLHVAFPGRSVYIENVLRPPDAASAGKSSTEEKRA